MAIKFTIRNTAGKAVKEGDTIVRYSGTGEPFSRISERPAAVLERDAKGIATKWTFLTGLDEEKVEYYKWFTDDEKQVVRDSIKELKPSIVKAFGGDKMINPENFSFWKMRREVNILKLGPDNIDVFYDTENPVHALLYLSILAGAFIEIVAPNRDWAEKEQIPHYLALEVESNDYGDEEDIRRSDAHGELALLRKEFGKDALYILAWCLQYDTNAFGAYNYSVSEKDLINYHIKYIDGKLSTKRKRNMPKVFIEYAEKWRAAQTRQLLYVEAYVKAGEYYNFISQREKKYVTSDGTVLGNTINEAVKNLMSPKFKIDLANLRDSVEAKWKE